MNSINSKKINELLKYFSGDSVIPLGLYLLSFPFVMLITIFLEADLTSFSNVLGWTWVAFLSICVTFLYILFFKYVVFAHADQVPISLGQVVIYTFFLGLIKGTSTYYLSVWFNLHNHPADEFLLNEHMFTRVIPALILAFWFVPTMTWISFTLNRFRKLRSDLITQAAKLELENQSYKKLIEESKLSMRKKMQSIFQEIKTELDKIGQDNNFEKEWTKIADLVRNAAFYEIRPQSHALWKNTNIKDYRNLSILYFLQSAIRLNPFPWKIVIPLFFVTTYPFLEFQIGNTSIRLLLIGLLIIFIMYLIGDFIIRRIQNNKYFVFILIQSILAIFLVSANNAIDYSFPVASRVTLTFVGILWLLILSLSCSLIFSFQQTKNELIKDIELTLNQKRLHKEMLKQIERRINTKLAKFLHGNVQARLMSNALQLELASKNSDKDLANKELIKLSQDLLDDYGVMSQFETTNTFAEAMEKLKESWAGICEIEILGTKLLNLDKMILRDFIEDAIAEAVANSVRHGQADHITVLFRKLKANLLEVSIADNGVGPQSSNAGMGSEIFNLLSGKNWQLIPNYNKKGSLLVLNIDTSFERPSDMGVEA